MNASVGPAVRLVIEAGCNRTFFPIGNVNEVFPIFTMGPCTKLGAASFAPKMAPVLVNVSRPAGLLVIIRPEVNVSVDFTEMGPLSVRSLLPLFNERKAKSSWKPPVLMDCGPDPLKIIFEPTSSNAVAASLFE